MKRRSLSKRFSRSIRFWLVVVALCFATALLALGVRTMFLSIGDAKHTRYEPVDVPPPEVSPRHAKEREEYERRERAVKGEERP